MSTINPLTYRGALHLKGPYPDLNDLISTGSRFPELESAMRWSHAAMSKARGNGFERSNISEIIQFL